MADYAIHDTTLIAQADILRKKFGTNDRQDPADYAYKMNLMGLLEEKTQASAPVCSFDDGADDVPTKSLVVTIPPTLSGVSLLNEKQTGRNLCQNNLTTETVSGVTITVNADGTITLDGTATARITRNLCTNFEMKAGTYTLSCGTSELPSSCYFNINISGGGGGSCSRNTPSLLITLPETRTATYIRIDLANGSTFDNLVIYPMLEIGSTAHDYEPYTTPTTYTAQLGRTIYGGEVDIVNGTGKEQYQKVKVSDLTWQKSTASGKDFFIANISEQENANTHDVAIDITGLTYAGMVTIAAMNDKSLAKWLQSVRIYDTSVSTVSDLLSTYGNGEIVFYLKDTEQTDFTFDGQEIPTRLGVNNFWSEQGDTEVTYRSSGTVTPVLPTLISKTITENGTYSAEDDGADGYDEVTVNVSGGGGAQPERLVYFKGTEQYTESIPPAQSIDYGAKYSEYLSYDSTTKKFTVLKAFDAMVTCWVREYRDYYSDYSYGGFQKNGVTVCNNYRNSGQAINSVGGTWFYLKFAVGDTFNAHSESNAYPQQHFKVYLLDLDMPSNFMAFADEEA